MRRRWVAALAVLWTWPAGAEITPVGRDSGTGSLVPLRAVSAVVSGTVTTTAPAGYATLLSVTTGACRTVVLWFSASANNPIAATTYYRVSIDGIPVASTAQRTTPLAGVGLQSAAIVWRQGGLADAAHVVTVAWNTSAGTSTINSALNGSHASLVASCSN